MPTSREFALRYPVRPYTDTQPYRFDYGDFSPSDPEAGVPFVQMLALTDPELAMMEFQTVRQRQVMKNDQKLAQGGNSTGSLSLQDGGLELFTQPSRSQTKRDVVVFHSVAHAAVRPMRFHHRVMNCMNQVADAYGPATLALLAGTFGIVLMMCLIAVVMGIRALIQMRRGEDGYEPLELKGDEGILFDENRDADFYNDYHHPNVPDAIPSPPSYGSNP